MALVTSTQAPTTSAAGCQTMTIRMTTAVTHGRTPALDSTHWTGFTLTLSLHGLRPPLRLAGKPERRGWALVFTGLILASSHVARKESPRSK